LLSLAVLLAGCTRYSDSHPTKADPAACKAHLRKLLEGVMDAGETGFPTIDPDACAGVDDATQEKLTREVLNEKLGGAASPPSVEAIKSSLDALDRDNTGNLEDGITPTP
jgi:hypothetical protein